MKRLEDLDLSKDRSSDFVIKIWEIIESYLIMCMGMSNHVKLYYTLDSDETTISFESSDKKNIIPIKDIKNPINNNILYNLEISYDIFITIINEEKDFNFDVIDCNYYYLSKEQLLEYEENEYGTIFFESKINGSIKDIQNIKHNFISLICKETQYAINYIINEKEIKENPEIDLDAKIEQLLAFSKIYNISLEESYKRYKIELYINLEESKIIKQLIEKDYFSEK